MGYKDKDKQREANRERQKRRRDKIKLKSVTTEGVTQGVTDKVTTITLPVCVPKPVQDRYNCYPCEPEYMDTINHLLKHTLTKLKEIGTWIPVWRYTAGESIATTHQVSSGQPNAG